MPVLIGYSFALLTAGLTIAGDYYIKVAADSGRSMVSPSFAIGALLYFGAAAMWFISLTQIGLAQAGVAFSMLTLVAVCLLGVFAFDEKLHLKEALGICFALFSMCLMVRFT